MDQLRIPHRFTLPFGFTVKIKLISPKNPILYDTETKEQLDGLWLVDERTIYINKELPPRKLRYILLHESMHCVADWQHDAFIMNKAKPTGG